MHRLTDRDHEVLLALWRFQYLSVAQIQRLLFPSTQTVNRRLRILSSEDYVEIFSVPGLPDRLVRLRSAGAAVVAGSLELPLAATGWTRDRGRPKDHWFARHFLRISDFRIALLQACRCAPVRLLGFIPEYVGRKPRSGAYRKYIQDVVADIAQPGSKISHTPDGVFALSRAERAGLFFLEVDRGTEVISHPARGVGKLVRFYLNAIASRAFERYQEDFGVTFEGFRILIVTSTLARLRNIQDAAAAISFEPSNAKSLIWITTVEATECANVLTDTIWRTLDPEDRGGYAIVA